MKNALAALAASLVLAAHAAEIKVLSAVGFKVVMQDAAEAYGKSTGDRVVVTYGTLGQVVKLIEEGEAADVIVIPRQGLDPLARQGAVGAVTPIARSVVAMAVAEGTPKPDISTEDGFRKALVSAKSVTTPDPATGGVSAVHFRNTFERMKLTEQLTPKLSYQQTLGRDGLAKEAAAGNLHVVLNQMQDLSGVPGLDVVGPLPESLQLTTIFAAGVTSQAANPRGARAFVDYLRGDETRSLVTAKGLIAVQ